MERDSEAVAAAFDGCRSEAAADRELANAWSLSDLGVPDLTGETLAVTRKGALWLGAPWRAKGERLASQPRGCSDESTRLD